MESKDIKRGAVGGERAREEAAERIKSQSSELVKLVTEGTRIPWRG